MIKIMTDISADVPKDFIEEHNLAVLPFYINFGEESILADKDYAPQAFYDKLKTTDEIPSTSQCTPDTLENMFRELGEGGASVIYASIPAKGSGIVNTAHMIANELNENEGFDITIVESKGYSMALGKPVMNAVLMAEEGKSKEEIIKYLSETFDRDHVYFMVDDLTFLKKGGRIKATTAVITNLLDIKPILYNNDEGMVEVFAKVRGSKKAVAALVDQAVEKMENPKENEVILLESEAGDKVELAKKLLEKKLAPKTVSVYNIGTVITSHAGPGVLGIYFKHK